MVEPGLAYMDEKFAPNGPLKRQLAAFEAAHLLHPAKIHAVPAVAIQMFEALPSTTPAWRAQLMHELPEYRRLAHDASREEDVWLWWDTHKVQLPSWHRFACLCALLQPSSAAAERVFSKLRAYVTRRQENALEESIEATVMLNYNEQQRRNGGSSTQNDHKVSRPSPEELIQLAADVA